MKSAHIVEMGYSDKPVICAKCGKNYGTGYDAAEAAYDEGMRAATDSNGYVTGKPLKHRKCPYKPEKAKDWPKDWA